ncbi:endonuclease/exonuclease/phosphatase family protein [Streptomyces sp. NPDC048659]|uniref:endonuclease/exonuclease/phosphatase family protein n=1 Tax=Streptomyces sp. NPDC048659 TaxID=3155489 RepID=UPI00344773DB
MSDVIDVPSTAAPRPEAPRTPARTPDREPGCGRSGRWRRGRLAAAGAVVVALLMVGHAAVPNVFGNPGSLLETFLPWLGLGVLFCAALAALRRSASAGVAVLLAAGVWCASFGGALLDKRAPGGGDLTVVSQNVGAENPDPAGTARVLAASGAGLLALEELSPATTPAYERALGGAYPHHAAIGTVGLWSAYPLREIEALPIMPWTRALRVVADTPKGPVAVYVAHLASVRVHPTAGFTTFHRNEAAGKLAEIVRAEALPRVILAGDFNGTVEDRALRPVTEGFRSAQAEAGDGFGFSWPAAFPVARIDHVLVRGGTPVAAWTLPRTGSDHLPVAASLRW